LAFASCRAYSSLYDTKLDNLLLRPDTHLSPYDFYQGKTPAWAAHLHAIGDIAVVKTTKMQAKLHNKSFPAIYLRPSDNHKGDTNIFWNSLPKPSIESRSAVFLPKIWRIP
jgi:hypothetical protein